MQVWEYAKESARARIANERIFNAQMEKEKKEKAKQKKKSRRGGVNETPRGARVQKRSTDPGSRQAMDLLSEDAHEFHRSASAALELCRLRNRMTG